MNKNQSLIQFTPRQVIMALESQSAKKEKKEKKNSKKGSSEALEGSKEIILNGGDLSVRGKGREVLLRSIAGFLESNGFKKTLAVFQSEAQIEENSWKSPDVNLNEFAAKLSESSYFLAVPAIGSDKLEDIEKETEKKTRKKSTKGTSIEQTADEKTALEKSKLVDREQQHEKKKRKKKSSEELKPVEQEREEANQKKKNKKKKKESEVEKETQEEEEKEKASVKETTVENEEKTVSKKRKKGDEENMDNDGKKRKLEANGTSPEEEQSAEPNSAKAFKRVKVEEVKFVDERLQDNSYWAKDGADSGYGAKAQQILEQVRGRDFRHEKTKKKRGTYRGGQIDLQSHSIKFNYSDEE